MITENFKLIMAIIAALFAVATLHAQEAKKMYVMKQGSVTHEIAVSDVDSIIFYEPDIYDLKQQIYNNRLPTKAMNEQIKILFLGSSWGADTWILTNKVFYASGINMLIGAYGAAGATMQFYVDAYKNNTLVDYYTSENGSEWSVSSRTITYGLTFAEWDVIIFQQSAFQSFRFETYQPSMTELLKILKTNALNKKVCFGINQTWTPAKDTPELLNFGFSNQMDAYNATFDANNRARINTGIDVIIPCGSAVFALRSTSLNTLTDLTRDNIHLDAGIGRYLTACTFFEAIISPIYGISILGNSYRTTAGTPVTNGNAEIIQKCAIIANANRYGFNDMSDF